MKRLAIELDGVRGARASCHWAVPPGGVVTVSVRLVALVDITEPVGLAVSEAGVFRGVFSGAPSFTWFYYPLPVVPGWWQAAPNLPKGGEVVTKLFYFSPSGLSWRVKAIDVFAVINGGL